MDASTQSRGSEGLTRSLAELLDFLQTNASTDTQRAELVQKMLRAEREGAAARGSPIPHARSCGAGRARAQGDYASQQLHTDDAVKHTFRSQKLGLQLHTGFFKQHVEVRKVEATQLIGVIEPSWGL